VLVHEGELRARRAPAVDVFAVGDYVLRHAPPRTKKGENKWRGPYRVMKVEGERYYSLQGESKRWLRSDVNDLKRVTVPADMSVWTVQASIRSEVLEGWGRDAKEIAWSGEARGLEALLRQDWRGKQVELPGVLWEEDEVEAVMAKVIEQQPLFVVMVVLHMPCEKWFRRLEGVMDVDWVLLNADQREVGAGVLEGEILCDAQGRGVGELVFPVWLAEVKPPRKR
jgi:hypothetical protein